MNREKGVIRMTCKKCSTIPKLDYQNVQVYASLGADHLYSALKLSLQVLKYHFIEADDYLVITVPNFELLISELETGEFFDPLELLEVLLLPVVPGQAMTFNLFKQTKTLAYWTQLLHAQSLISVLEESRIKTLFQPIVRASDLSIYGYEALSRGLHDDSRLIAPMGMFKQAKALDLLFNLDRQCREKAIESAALRKIEEKLFINFVPTAIYNPDECLKSTDEAVNKFGMNQHKIVFEVVETEKVDDYNHLKKILNYYKNKGFQTALDDVGSGFSTLEVYNLLNTDFIKIDKSIIRHIQDSESNQNFFHKLMTLKSQHGVTVLAEGVETKEEADFLTRHGIDLMQGYYFGKPV